MSRSQRAPGADNGYRVGSQQAGSVNPAAQGFGMGRIHISMLGSAGSQPCFKVGQ